MIGLVLVAHAGLAREFLAATEMIVGKCHLLKLSE
jgi:mannose/fructose-specific phosphotransferase system component IIA